jgi:cytochrome c peroxidase
LIGERASQTELVYQLILMSLEIYQQNPTEFAPFTSKYDAYLRKQIELSPQELHGLTLFNDEKKGNCASCHPSHVKDGAFPVFSDWGHNALGIPRNPSIPANKNPAFYDLGLCGPERKDFAKNAEYCGLFRTPTLRNVTKRKVFFHNGALTDLHTVLWFYVARDLEPKWWYSKDAGGRVNMYDDLPAKYHKNINREPPFDRKFGDEPALTEDEIIDVIAFLKTLEDGYVVPAPATQKRNAP